VNKESTFSDILRLYELISSPDSLDEVSALIYIAQRDGKYRDKFTVSMKIHAEIYHLIFNGV
jgi:hypothetical protein